MKLFMTRKKKPTIVCIHGFGRRQAEEFSSLKSFFEKLGYKVEIPSLYNIEDPTDTSWQNWVYKADQAIRAVADRNERIILIGFSMGGVIASYLSNTPNVDKLILLSPAFDYKSFQNVVDYLLRPVKKNMKNTSLSPEFTKAFRNVIDTCKDSVKDIHVDTLILSCAEDEVIPLSSSTKAIKKISSNKKILMTLSNGQHRILDDPICGKIALENIQLFIEEKI